MISKQEIKGYLDSMLALEIKMKTTYSKLSREVKNKKLKRAFINLSKDETEHATLVKELMDLLKTWK